MNDMNDERPESKVVPEATRTERVSDRTSKNTRSSKRLLDYSIAGAIALVFVVFAVSNAVSSFKSASPVTTAGGSGSAHINAGMAFYNASDFKAAEAEFRQASQAEPNSALANNDLGAALINQKRWDDAIPVLQRAVSLDPGMDLARNNLAYALTQRGKGEDRQGSPSSRREPISANDHINAGMAFYNASNFTAAETEFRRAVQVEPNSAIAHNDLAWALINEKRWDEAIHELRKATELDPVWDLAKNNLAYALAQRAKIRNGK